MIISVFNKLITDDSVTESIDKIRHLNRYYFPICRRQERRKCIGFVRGKLFYFSKRFVGRQNEWRARLFKKYVASIRCDRLRLVLIHLIGATSNIYSRHNLSTLFLIFLWKTEQTSLISLLPVQLIKSAGK